MEVRPDRMTGCPLAQRARKFIQDTMTPGWDPLPFVRVGVFTRDAAIMEVVYAPRSISPARSRRWQRAESSHAQSTVRVSPRSCSQLRVRICDL